MKYKWDLTTIYKKREDFYFDMTLIRDKIKKLNEHREIKVDGINLYNLMMECFSIREINAKTLLYGTLNYYLDIHDDEMIKMKNYAEDLDRFVFNETYFIEELIFIIEEEKLSFFYEECPDLEKYRFYIDKVRRNSKYLVSNSVISYYNESINDNLIEYSSLIKNMDFGCVNGIKLDNSNIGVFLINEDRDIRKISFGSLNSSYLSLGDKFFDIFNNIISLRRDLSLKKGFNSVLEEKLFNEDIEVRNVDNLIKGVNHYIYLLSRYLKIKGCFLGIESLCFYDINLPFINYYRSYDLDSAVDIFRCAFSLLGNEYLDSINYLINNNYFDLECNDKKHPSMTFSFGNYCFTNYKNRYFDIKNLAHELGYVVNNYLKLAFTKEGWTINIQQTSNIYVNNSLLQNLNKKLNYGDTLFVLGVKITLYNGMISINNPSNFVTSLTVD